MRKRIIALITTLVLCISLLPYEVFANMQSPIGGISDNSIIGHVIEMKETKPKVELRFVWPELSSIPDNSAIDGKESHEPTHYQVNIDEYPSGKKFKYPSRPGTLTELGISKNNTLNKGIEIKGLDNGRLYKMSITPSHRHGYKGKDENIIYKDAPETGGIEPYEFVLTDFDTRMEGVGGAIEVTWEDSGYKDMEYEIGYIQGDYAGKSLPSIRNNNKGHSIQTITSEDIEKNKESYKDPKTGRNRFKYTITNNIATGQMYSAYVLSKSTTIDGKTVLQNTNTPKVVTATTEIGLEVDSLGQDKIRLKWDTKFIRLPVGGHELTKAEIMEYNVGETSGRTIATLYGEAGAGIGYYEYREPKEKAEYQIIFTYTHKTTNNILTPIPQSVRVLYVPGELIAKPATPKIPEPIGPNTKVKNKADFLLPGDNNEINELWKSDHTFHANMVTPPNLNLVWSAYKSDLSLLYDIWITDDIAIVEQEVAPIIGNLSFNNGQNSQGLIYNKEKTDVIGFRHILEEYYNSDMERLPIVPNKAYYIKIVAKKQYAGKLEPSIPAIVTIIFDSDGEVFAPPMISKPPLALDPKNVGTTSITIEWPETWYEIMAKDPSSFPVEEQEKAKEWNAKVYTTESSISFINKGGMQDHVLKGKQDIDALKNILGGAANYEKKFIDRSVSLGENIQYEYKYILYEDILTDLLAYNKTTSKTKDIEEYIEMLMRGELDSNPDHVWMPITPTTVKDGENISWRKYKQEGLEKNTSYIFFVRPYRYDDDGKKLQTSLPTWIIGTTLPDGGMDEGIPTVPRLSLSDKGDSYISVKWKYNSAFDYEIRYSRLEDPETAIVWPFEINTDIDDPNYQEHGKYAEVTINGLFPETRYNIWIRAKQKSGKKISNWSNPVTPTTDGLKAPTSPSGLGVASYNSILEAGKDFKAVDTNHITVEWERVGPDKDLDNLDQGNQRVQKEYKYTIELADNPEFIDVKKITVDKNSVGKKEGSAEVLSENMVYFGELIANRPYYVRAKTILIAKDMESNREIIKESDYTSFIRIITKPSQEEYDGGDRENEVIYPDKIEETYDGDTWTYEILDTQKVIDEMLKENKFRYVVPVQKYRDRRDPTFRVIKIPQPVIRALINRGMELEIRTNILTIQIPSKALEAHMIEATADGMVQLVFETLNPKDPHNKGMGYEYGLLSKPERMSISVKGPKGIKTLNTVDSLLKVKINMPNQSDYESRNLGGYTFDVLDGVWKRSNHQFDKVNMQLTYTSGAIGTYVVYEKTRVPAVYEYMTYSMTNVAKKHDIVGLGTIYIPTRSVTGSEYINIMLGIAEKRNQIKPNIWPTAEEIARAKNSGIYMGQPNSMLTEEAAISGVVKLYELVNGVSVRPQTSMDLRTVSRNYRDNIQKAYTLGLISNINPTQSMTYAELFSLIEQVID